MPGKGKKKFISQRAFAKMIGVTHPAVVAAMDNGRLQKGIHINPKNGHRKILPKIALKEWEATKNPKYEQARQARKKSLDANLAAGKRDDGNGKTKASFQELKLAKETLLMQKAALDFRKAKGELVDKDIVHKVLFEFGKMFKDSLVVIPDRITDLVMAAKNRNEIHTIIKTAIEDSLRDLSETKELDFNKNE